jgi:hypothetical protein
MFTEENTGLISKEDCNQVSHQQKVPDIATHRFSNSEALRQSPRNGLAKRW